LQCLNWEKKRKPGGGYSFPDTLFQSQPKKSEEEELRRLFYVALTRAELKLYISYSKFRNDGKPLEPSMFLAEIQDVHRLAVQQTILDTSVLSEFTLVQFEEESKAPEIENMKQNW
jgi:DNA helicase-2/ATP-dependent DNA helicase PcrA